jgi:lysophospholipase L1-like esterase
MIPKDWSATLCAVDGTTISEIRRQIPEVPSEATCLFVSVGGNDAIDNAHLLTEMTKLGPMLLAELAAISDKFRSDYKRAIEAICSLKKPVYLCTIYNGNLESNIAAAAKAAVAIFNDKIYSVANEKGLPVIDLRRICNLPVDYATPIEPSAIGGQKIARSIYENVLRMQKDRKL